MSYVRYGEDCSKVTSGLISSKLLPVVDSIESVMYNVRCQGGRYSTLARAIAP
jgi:hypothetical protein